MGSDNKQRDYEFEGEEGHRKAWKEKRVIWYNYILIKLLKISEDATRWVVVTLRAVQSY